MIPASANQDANGPGSAIPATTFAAACYSARVLNLVTTPSQKTSPAQLAAAALALGALWFVLCRQLSGEWSVNEQYSYGWFVPFFTIFLFWLRWEDRPAAGTGPAEAPSSKLQAPSSRRAI